MAEPQRLLDEERSGWDRFLATVRSVDPARDEPIVTAEGWSAKDAVVHVAWWLEDCARVLEEIGDGRWDPDGEPQDRAAIDAINAGHPERARTLSWDDAVARLVAARERARAAFEALGDVTPEARSWFEESASIHYEEHVASLAALRGAGKAAG